MSRTNPVASKSLGIVACPALAAFPALGDADNYQNGRVANYRIASQIAGGGGLGFTPKIFTFENIVNVKGPGVAASAQNTNSITFSIEVSADGVTYVATTAANNYTAVTQVVLPPSTRRAFDVMIPAATPYFRITAIGGGQLEFGVDNDAEFERLRPIGMQPG